MDESLDITKVTKLFSHIYNAKINVEFGDDEIDAFNSYIKDGDVSSIIHLFESKEVMCDEVLKDMIYSKVDSLWQFVIDESYKKYEHLYLNRDELLNQLSDYERIAMLFKDFDYQVENGGLCQWYHNYVDDLDSLYDFLDDCDYEKKQIFY